MIKVYIHTPELTGWQSVFVEMLEKMDKSGLIAAADEINFCLNGVHSDMEMFLWPLLTTNPKFKIVHVHGDASKWEWPTLNRIRLDADKDDSEDHKICYVHLKGLSRENLHDQKAVDWRNYLSYWTIEQWAGSVAQLEYGAEVVGVNWMDQPFPHFSGNFWWATTNYIRRLRNLQDPATITWGKASEYIPRTLLDPGNFRFEHEAWIGSATPNKVEVDHSHGKSDPSFHYNFEYPSTNYKIK